MWHTGRNTSVVVSDIVISLHALKSCSVGFDSERMGPFFSKKREKLQRGAEREKYAKFWAVRERAVPPLGWFGSVDQCYSKGVEWPRADFLARKFVETNPCSNISQENLLGTRKTSSRQRHLEGSTKPFKMNKKPSGVRKNLFEGAEKPTGCWKNLLEGVQKKNFSRNGGRKNASWRISLTLWDCGQFDFGTALFLLWCSSTLASFHFGQSPLSSLSTLASYGRGSRRGGERREVGPWVREGIKER